MVQSRRGFVMIVSRSIRVLIIFCIATLLAGFPSVSSASAEPSRRFIMTSEEQAYLDSLKTRPIVISYSYDLMQAESDGAPYGMLGPVIDVLRNEFGLTVDMIKTDWRDAFLQVESGEVDFYGLIAISEIRRQKYITVDPFYRSYSKIITRVDEPIHSMLGLYNRSIGLLEGSVMSKTMQAYLGPNGRTVYFPTMDDMIKGLSSGLIDAFATVDNAEFEILSNDDIQFEFSIENFYVDQGFISMREDMRMLASLLSRYMTENPQISDEIISTRRLSLLRYAREWLSDEIAALQDKYHEVTMYADSTFYPLCYEENGTIKGMQLEINKVFEELTGIGTHFSTDKDYPDGIATAIEKIKAGECLAYVGGYYDTDTWNDPDIQYSPMVWLETIRTYSYKDNSKSLLGKTLGSTRFTSDYLGWNNTTGTAPIFYNSHRELLKALKKGEVDAIFMGEMRFNYGYTILGDYNLREISGISAEATMHMLYGSQNEEFNAVFNEAMVLFQIMNPRAMGQWKSQIDKYKYDYIRMRHTQQIWMTVAIVVFFIMLSALVYLLRRVRQSLLKTEEYNLALLDKVHYDALTGIYNRRFLEENMRHIIRSMSRSGGMISLLMIDVDFFKKYNDTYGHSMGDYCLKTVADALACCITRVDDFVARYGGEEFVVVLPNTDESGARAIANRLLESIRERNLPHEKNGVADCVTVSIGATTGIATQAQSVDDYIKRADKALYMSKQSGRDRYTFIEFDIDGGLTE